MMNLFLAIFTSAMIPLVLKYGQDKTNRAVVLSMNYIIASLVYLVMLIINREIIYGSIGLPIILGAITGLLFYGGFYFYQRAVHQSGASIASAFGKMGILIPMLASIVLWNEIPTLIQTVGILLAIGAIVLMTFDFKSLKNTHINTALLMFLLVGGCADFMSKVFERYNDTSMTVLFLFTVFFVALIASSYESFKVNKITKDDIIIGSVLGVPNLLTSYFLILSLGVIKASVVFPMYSGGTIVFTAIFSALLYKEKLSKKEYIGIGAVILALILINI